MSGRCSCCEGEFSGSPLLSYETLKSLKWSTIQDNRNSTVKSILHSFSCGDLQTRSESISVICCQLLPNLCPGSEALTSSEDGLSFTVAAEIESVVKTTGRKTYDLLIQQRLEDAIAEIKFLHDSVVALLQCALSHSHVSTSLSFQFTCLPSLSHLLTFCHDTEQSSSCTDPSVSPVLGSLFKTSYSLLKLCLEASERIAVDHTHHTKLISMLVRLTEVAVTFDPTLILLCWKYLAKFLCRVKPRLPDLTQAVTPVVEQLSITMETKTKECVMSERGMASGSPLFLKLLKLCRFLSTLAVKIATEFEEVLAYDRFLSLKVVQTLLSVQATVLRNGFHGDHWKEYESSILLVREPLIQSLIKSPIFTHQLLDAELVDAGQHTAWALNLCSLMKLFPALTDGIQDEVMGELSNRVEQSHTSKLLDAVFNALHMSYAEVASPVRIGGVMCNGQPQRMVTFYEYMLTHLCSLILILPARHRSKMEHVLLRHMFARDAHCSLMAADAFVFFSKQCGPDAILLTVQQLSTLLTSLPSCHCELTSVISRLLPLLPSTHLLQLTSSFPSAQFPRLASLFAPTGLLEDSQVNTHLLDQVRHQLSSQKPNLVSMHSALEQLNSALVGCTSLPPSLSSLPQLLVSVLSSLSPSTQLSTELLALTIHLSSLLVSFISTSHLLSLLQAVEKVSLLSPLPHPLALAMPCLLKGCGHLTLPPPQRSELLHLITNLFQTLLHSSHWLAQQLSLEAFKTFAEYTPHAEVVERCIPSELSDHVVNFIHKVPYGRGLVGEQQVQTLLQQHQTKTTTKTTPTVSEATPPTDDLRDLVEAWEKLSAHVQPTAELLSQLNQLCSQIQTFISQHS